MHSSSIDKMLLFKRKYLTPYTGKPLTILDIGSMDINGSYRPVFDEPGWTYSGLDMEPGENVNIVVSNPYNWRSVPSGSFDVVVSGQAFEHIEYPWLTIYEISRVLKPGGLCCIIAPSTGYEHRYPVDTYRYHPDGLRSLIRVGDLIEEEAYYHDADLGYHDGSEIWKDCVIIGRKRPRSLRTRIRSFQRSVIRYFQLRQVSSEPVQHTGTERTPGVWENGNPLVTVNHQNISHFLIHSHQVDTPLSLTENQVSILATGDDPFIILSLGSTISNEAVLVKILLSCPADTTAEVYFRSKKQPEYSSEKCRTFSIHPGENELLALIGPDWNGILRIDPGKNPGMYTIHSIEFRSCYWCDPEKS